MTPDLRHVQSFVLILPKCAPNVRTLIDGDSRNIDPHRACQTSPDFWSAEQDLSKEPAGIVKGLMEKLERQEQLSNALADD